MGTISYVFGLLCLIAMLGHWRPHRHLLNNHHQTANHQITNNQVSNYQKSKGQISSQPNTQKANQLLNIAKSQIGIREATGNNDGLQVEKYLAYTGNKKGEPWCASFVSWVFAQAGYSQPKTAWSPALFPKQRLVDKAIPAAVFGIYFPDKGRIAHVGLVEQQNGDWLYTIEGNTNLAGLREGDGVYRKLRHSRTVKTYANWLPTQKKGALP